MFYPDPRLGWEFSPMTIAHVKTHVADLSRLSDHARSYAHLPKADNTLRAYRSDWAQFCFLGPEASAENSPC